MYQGVVTAVVLFRIFLPQYLLLNALQGKLLVWAVPDLQLLDLMKTPNSLSRAVTTPSPQLQAPKNPLGQQTKHLHTPLQF